MTVLLIFVIRWTDEVDYALLGSTIESNMLDKAGLYYVLEEVGMMESGQQTQRLIQKVWPMQKSVLLIWGVLPFTGRCSARWEPSRF